MVAAALGGHDAVIMSNEWSASVPTLVDQGSPVNHQWSKGEEFEVALAQEVATTLGPELSVFSYLRPRSELWVAEQFAQLASFHPVFRSCNRAFHQNAAQRLGQWCGVCDKCCFIDLILAPFMPAADLATVFDGREPLANAENLPRFAALVGVDREAKPFECVGDVNECRSALSLTAKRDDRRHNPLIGQLLDLMAEASRPDASPSDLLAPIGPHYIPERYAPRDLLARSG
jgi:UDP-N-acetyl-alpha-D-muramoyl-L-alanyl-L-glutamate epimerase